MDIENTYFLLWNAIEKKSVNHYIIWSLFECKIENCSIKSTVSAPNSPAINVKPSKKNAENDRKPTIFR